jgi:hypothetical protein
VTAPPPTSPATTPTTISVPLGGIPVPLGPSTSGNSAIHVPAGSPSR